jgi:hypothetical protein
LVNVSRDLARDRSDRIEQAASSATLLHRPRCFIAQVAESAADNKPITARRQGQQLFHRIGDV